MKVGILNFINAIIVSIVSLIAIINSGAKFIFNSEYEQAIIGVIAAAILTINLVYLGTRLARIFGKTSYSSLFFLSLNLLYLSK